MIYVVLGMHKSGTTLVAQLLHESGIDMGSFDPALGYGDGNTYERHDAQAVNREILRGCLIPPLDHLLRRRSRPSHDRAGYPANRDSQSYLRRRALAARLRDPRYAAAIDDVIARASAHPDWGFKDPRTALTYDAWRARLPEHRLVVVYRGLAQALQRGRTGVRHPWRSLRVLHAWTVHNAMILAALESSPPPFVVLRYESLMQGDDGVKRLADFVGRRLHDARDPSLYRSRTAGEPPPWVQPLRRVLPADPIDVEARLDRLAR